MPAAKNTSQKGRLIQLETSLGKDKLIPLKISGHEGLSTLFRYTLEVFSDTEHNLQPDKLIGTEVSFAIQQPDKAKTLRHFHGYVDSLVETGSYSQDNSRSTYSITVVPWLDLLGKTSNCRIFQDETIPKIIEQVFAKHKFKKSLSKKLSQPHPVHAYVVQYHETDLAFVERLMRREGIAYYFTHEKTRHTLNLIDDGNKLPEMKPSRVTLQHSSVDENHLTIWEHSSRQVTGTFRQSAYNYKKPAKAQKLADGKSVKGEASKIPNSVTLEHYDYSTEYTKTGEGTSHTQLRNNEVTARFRTINASGNSRYLKAGHIFKLDVIPVKSKHADRDKEFTIIDLEWTATDLSHMTQSTHENAVSFRVNIEAIPKGGLIFPEAAPAPRIEGMQTAIVNGPPGAEIHTDKRGRIQAQFHWDERSKGTRSGSTTCWLRVMQSMSGSGFGSHFTPRIGQEVVVAFENGNPDRPFVLGALYNEENPPPFVSEKGTRNGYKSRSTKGGQSSNFNEMSFEDKKGKEQVYIHAEKDFDVKVKHNQAHIIDNDLTYKVGNNEKHKVANEIVMEAGSKILLKVGGSTVTIDGSSITIKAGTVNIN